MRSCSLPLLALLLLLQTGCSTPTTLPAEQFYHLGDPPRPERSPNPIYEGVMAVSPFRGDVLFQERALLVADDEGTGQIRLRRYHFWSDSPSRMLQRRLVRYLDAAGIADTVVADSSALDARWRIRGTLIHFEQQLRGKDSVVKAGVRLELIDTHERRLVLAREYLGESPLLGSRSAEAAVTAWATLIDTLFDRWLGDLEKSATSRQDLTNEKGRHPLSAVPALSGSLQETQS